MKITVEIPYRNVSRQNLKEGDGILVEKSHQPLNRFYAKIVELEMDENEDTEVGGGGFTAK